MVLFFAPYTAILSVQSEVTVVFDKEVYDVNADFASNTFTAPVTGRYLWNVKISFKDKTNRESYADIHRLS